MKTVGNRYFFADFVLDPGERRLLRGDAPVELGARYLDALVLLVEEADGLVTKDRFMDEVWRGVPVTDEALTQAIRTLRRELGDDAANPRFIETVPRHGYRFVAEVESQPVPGPVRDRPAATGPAPVPAVASSPRHAIVRLGTAGVAGGAVAGALGGLAYGFGAASDAATGGASSVLAVLAITVFIAALGAVGVSFGAAAGRLAGGTAGWTIAGGALGGMMEGGFVKLIGVDAFNLVFGRAPTGMTGGLEGLALGGAVGLAVWLAARRAGPVRSVVLLAALVGAGAGLVIALAGGVLMAGSLALLAAAMPDSHLSLAPLGALAGEAGFGPLANAVTATLEGALFAGCVVGAMAWSERTATPRKPRASGDVLTPASN
ncbi:winged helix-turn-helix domain-containing protein [Aurantiacibacter spongiae]|uniref:Transcriptional regulator n=1 Tax=Aurantiacibacter spongiae TaxID=2488860 RepID=A0A3N5CUU3_9SPHN|nr:transcriptional regulator [Aurantiacibacter spongiae]RPF71220.1 transcriptional regulator [Aurantiacibacter spongiae]